jgi:hypothetical protein
MNVAVSQEWMLFTSVFSFAGVLVVAGFTISWYERRTSRHRPRPRSTSPNAGPHHPV